MNSCSRLFSGKNSGAGGTSGATKWHGVSPIGWQILSPWLRLWLWLWLSFHSLNQRSPNVAQCLTRIELSEWPLGSFGKGHVMRHLFQCRSLQDMTPFQRSKGDRPWGKHYGVISAERSEDLSFKTTWWQHYFLPAGVFHHQGPWRATARMNGQVLPESLRPH